MTSRDDKSGALRFDVATPLGFRVRATESHWQFIVTAKHPSMAGRDEDVKRALEEPDEVRRSRRDLDVYLFYRRQGERRWVCAVSKKLNGEGFLITCYPTDAVKEGEHVWPR